MYQSICTSNHCHIDATITGFVTVTPYKFHGAPQTLAWQSCDLVQCHLKPHIFILSVFVDMNPVN